MEFRNKLFFWRRRAEMAAAVDEEYAFHIAERADELAGEGLTRAEAERRARLEFGPVARITEEAREAWRFGWLEDLAADLRYGARALRREPGFLVSAVLSLALGIGVNTAIFSLTMEILTSRPSAREPESIVLARLGGSSHLPLADLQ
ncbi:MAG: ABC transporter substrate-binding protein, partial [Blastocatellia bacterium]|nr:ABC transporter substrate-binding protein [Blastocatellia bacterium]